MIRYIDGPEVRFTVNDAIYLDAQFVTGECFEMLEPRCLFPISGQQKYITLLDGEGSQVAVIRNLEGLLPDAREAVESALHEYYMMPRILRFISMTDKFKIWIWTAETDRGVVCFEIRNHIASVKALYDGRILIKDGNDNRYEIPDINMLDKKSRRLLTPKI